MRAKDFITEAFDRPYAFNWSRGDYGDWDISVKLPDGSPLNIAFVHEGDNVWHVAFDRGHSQDITGEGDAQRIFATVLASIQQFIGKQNPDKLYFSASKDVEHGQNPESRARLYERMVHRYAAALGYDVVVDDRRIDSTFILNKKQPVTEEEFNGIDIDMDVEGDEIMVTAMSNGRELGHVLFVEEGEYLMPQDLEVDERFQGQGIAAAMYDYVKSKGYKIRRSGQQTDAGAGFWDKHKGQGQNVWEQGVAEGFFGIDDKIKGKIQNVVSDLSDIPGMWDHKAQTFTDAGMDKLKTVLKNNPKYIKYALNLDYRDYEAEGVAENFADGKVKGKSRPGRVKRSGASCNGSVTDLRQRAKNASGERAKMYHWCANMKSGRKK